ncbi:MAG: LacI family DNA-binding transcriptional regulator [Chloroflexota bacterium]
MLEVTAEPSVTIAQVAALAGVSLGTASKAMNGKGRVHPVLREKVLSAAAQLGYRPHGPAQALRTGRSRTLALCVPTITNPTNAAICEGASRQAYAAGYALMICAIGEDPAVQAELLEVLRRQWVAAVIALPTGVEPEPFLSIQQSGTPVVFADRRPRAIQADLVTPDCRAGFRAATAHLLQGGRRRIGLLTSAPELSSNVARLAGYREAHAALGFPVDEALVRADLYGEAAAAAAVAELLALASPPDAILAGMGSLTLGALACLRDLGVTIPDDMALVGTGDISWARFVDPPLTMVEIDGKALGQAAVQAALERLGTGAPPLPARDVLLPLQLVVRASSTPRRSAPGLSGAASKSLKP